MTFPSGIQPGSGVGAAFMDLFIRNMTRQGVDDAMRQISRDSDKITEQAGKSLGDSLGDNMSDEVSKPSWIQKIKDAIARGFRRNRRKIPVDVDLELDQNAIKRATRAFANQAQGMLEGVGNILGKGLRSIGASVGNVGAGGPFSLLVGVFAVTLIPALIGAIAALLNVFAPLVNIILLLPGAIAILVAAIAPLIVAFNGIGDAIGAVISGDPERIAEAFKNISKEAQAVIEDLGPLMPWFRDFGRRVQSDFFRPLDDAIPRLHAAIGPEVITGFQRVARAAGEFFDTLIGFAEMPEFSKFLDQLFTSTANIFKTLGPDLDRFLSGLSNLGIVSLPVLEDGFAFISDKIGDLGDWLTKISQNGQFQQFMDDLMQALKDLRELGASGWNLITAIVGGADEQGGARGFLATLGTAIDGLAEFFRTDLGRAAIRGWITLAEVFVVVLVLVLGTFAAIGIAIEAVGQFFIWVIGLAEKFYNVLLLIAAKLGFIRGISGSTLGSSVANAIGAAVGAFAEGGIVSSPTFATLGEDYQREVVIPLGDPARARQLARESGLSNILNSGGGNNIVFGNGAIQVNFTGALPTEEEAFRTGAAVGSGIQSQLLSRNVRLAVRTR